jgi:ADP-ribose pyrophosphatase YjhB (NUDIX family)
MPMPDFVAELRALVGSHPLLLPGVRAIVEDGDGGVLMVRRADFDRWDLPSGIMEPGEDPAESLVREVFEETGMVVRPEGIVGVTAGREVAYDNGDRARYVTIVFRCSIVGGTLRPDGDETLAAAFLPMGRPPAAERLADVPGAVDDGAGFVWDEAWLERLEEH